VHFIRNKEFSVDQWRFWIDRGGTFTDIVAVAPDGKLYTRKLLSENPECYDDAALQGIRDFTESEDDIPCDLVRHVKMGTTVGTNALLERKGENTVLVINRGLRDLLRIGSQNRPDIFALKIVLPELLYSNAIEVDARIDAAGNVIVEPDFNLIRNQLQAVYADGIRSLAVVLMHAYNFPEYEKKIGEIAKEIGFEQISLSHEISPLIRIVGRGDTTVVDAYLSPLLRRYVDRVRNGFDESDHPAEIMFMQSHGGLIEADSFRGRDCILSGPAGGIVGAVAVSRLAGFDKVITFDMGGTSTDTAHYDGEYERVYETEVAGVRLRAPMLRIHTVAAGGGSLLNFDGLRMTVGPDSAGADPGPVCYRRGGPLAVTDCNVMLGRILPEFFPIIFGPAADQPLDRQAVRDRFVELTDRINAEFQDSRMPELVAEDFLNIAVENMAEAIKHISVRRGFNIREYALCCFGGAGGQHACRVAEVLGINRILLHPLAGVLSAYGMGLAERRIIRDRFVERVVEPGLFDGLKRVFAELEPDGLAELTAQGVAPEAISIRQCLYIRYEGTDTTLPVNMAADLSECVTMFEELHQQRFGFISKERRMIMESVAAEFIGHEPAPSETVTEPIDNLSPAEPECFRQVYFNGSYHETPVYFRDCLYPGHSVSGPAIIIEQNSTIVIEPGWGASINNYRHIILERNVSSGCILETAAGTDIDPMLLEIFNRKFMSVAEQMGYTLQNTAASVNIRERLDFSCALFDRDGELIANAPHIPVHLGAMSETVRALIRTRNGQIGAGDVYLMNSPYNGGTHLPDLTVISPYCDSRGQVEYYLASRGHHADVGGRTPGSIPSDSVTIDEEGILFECFELVKSGRFMEKELRDALNSGEYPARNPEQNIADLKAQIAANQRGIKELELLIEHYSAEIVSAYVQHVKNNAEEMVRRVVSRLADGSFCYRMDNGAEINVNIKVNTAERSAEIDFTGTSAQLKNNFNAPFAVVQSAVLYVFRCLVAADIPLNSGCLRPITIIVPDGLMLRPEFPAAVVAGNVETSQYVVDAILGALDVGAASQGTMNNFTFGDEQCQYYETVCGGSGAMPEFNGTSAVQTHMTNSRITDPEILENRFPVILETFSIRPDSGGKGHYRGGDGVVRKIRFLRKMSAAILSGHRKLPPFGMAGGEAGLCGKNYILRADGTKENLNGCASVQVEKNDVFVIETPGGGGYGYAE